MIRLHIPGFFDSDFSGNNTRLGDAQIIDDGTNYEVIDGNCGKGTNRLINTLKARGIYTPYLYITHAHYDHYYGIRKIINATSNGKYVFRPKKLCCYKPSTLYAHNSDIKSNIKALEAVIEDAKRRGIPVVYLRDGMTVKHGDIKFLVYRNSPTYNGNSDAYINDGSLSFWFPSIKYLTTGDAGLEVAREHGLKPVLIKGGHHGNDCVRSISNWLYDNGCRYYWDNDYSLNLTDFLMTGREDAIGVGMTVFNIHGDINVIFKSKEAVIYKDDKSYKYKIPYNGKSTLKGANATVVRKTMRGKFGTGNARITNLINAGRYPMAVQNKTNDVIRIAKGIKDGSLDYGKGDERIARIDAELGKGYGQLVQDYINVLFGIRESV